VRLQIHNVIAERVSATLELDGGKLKISDLRGDILGGKHRGELQADFTGTAPAYSGSGNLTNVSLEQMASTMRDDWISGTVGGTYQFKASGADSVSFWQSVEGGIRFDLRSATLPHISLGSEGIPLRVTRWQGQARLRDGKVEIEQGTLWSPGGAYEVSGTTSLKRELDFKLTAESDSKSTGAGSPVYSVTGTVAEPHVTVSPAPETQAKLKP
jgi:AsmA-like C-terminal region